MGGNDKGSWSEEVVGFSLKTGASILVNHCTGGIGKVSGVTFTQVGNPNKANSSARVNCLYPKPLLEYGKGNEYVCSSVALEADLYDRWLEILW